MANPPRSRKRVRVPHRAPDGSAFQKCDDCGASVPLALMDMHQCQVKKEVKRFRGNCEPVDVKKGGFSEEPRSAFHFFLESYTKTTSDEDMLEINRQAFEKWKVMSFKEKWPYILQEQKVEAAYNKVLQHEVNQLSQEDDDEADSAMGGKFAQDYEDSEHSGSYHCYWSEDWESFDIRDRLVTCPWHS